MHFYFSQKFGLVGYKIYGFCNNKDKCRFSNAELSLMLTSFFFLSEDWPCRFFHLKGFCNNKDKCRFSHAELSDEMREVLLAVREQVITFTSNPNVITRVIKMYFYLTIFSCEYRKVCASLYYLWNVRIYTITNLELIFNKFTLENIYTFLTLETRFFRYKISVLHGVHSSFFCLAYCAEILIFHMIKISAHLFSLI